MLEEKNKRGILLVATGHPYYGRMAYNLACSIRSREQVPVSVIWSERSLSHIGAHQLDIFDELIELPAKAAGGFAPKLYINELSPYEETIFLDADMLWVHEGKKPSELFEECKEVDFTAITEGWHDLTTGEDSSNLQYYYWAELAEIKEVYEVEGRIYQWRSEFMYFKKNERTDEFFKLAQSVHRNPNLKTARLFGMTTPDELGINIAAAKLGIHPHKVKWTPAYWHKLQGEVPAQLNSLEDWYLVSFGSNYATASVKRLYDQLTRVSMNKLGRQHIFSLHNKSEYLRERVKM